MNIDDSYIHETESYLQQHEETMPKKVYDFIKELCFTERKILELLEEDKRF